MIALLEAGCWVELGKPAQQSLDTFAKRSSDTHAGKRRVRSTVALLSDPEIEGLWTPGPHPTPSSNCPPTLARPEKSLQKDRNKETQAHRNGHSGVRQRTGNRIKGRCVPEGWGDLLPRAPPTPTITHGQMENSCLWKLFSVFSTWLFWYGWYLWKVSLYVRSRGHWGCTCSEFTKQIGLC